MNTVVTKIYDYSCPICEFMGSFDGKVMFDLEPRVDPYAVSLDVLVNPDNENEFQCLLAQFTERHVCNPDYTLDLPAYIVTRGKTYVGHVSGEQTQSELREKLQKLVSEASNQESETAQDK